jgi:hypothetical protein
VSVSSGCTLQSADSSSFDIVLPPSLSVSASTAAASVAAGGSFTANINVDNSGETTAQDISIAASGSGISSSCDLISTLDEGQSVAESCTVTATVAGAQTVTFLASSTNADSATDSFSISVTGGGGDPDDPGNGGGGTITGGSDENKTTRPTLVPGVGLRNNTKLQAAIEKVLAKGQLSDQARENLLRLSASITSDISTTRWFNVSQGKSKITTTMTYQGQSRVRNMMIYESVPKTFAQAASLITVSAPGGTVEIAEDDPSWVIMFPEIDPNDEITITYEVAGSRNSGIIDDMTTEVYAEALEEPPTPPVTVVCTPGQRQCSGVLINECSTDGTAWNTVETCQYGCNAATAQCNSQPTGPEGPGEFPWSIVIVLIVAIVILVVAVVVYFTKFSGKTKKKSMIPGQ